MRLQKGNKRPKVYIGTTGFKWAQNRRIRGLLDSCCHPNARAKIPIAFTPFGGFITPGKEYGY